MHRLDNPRGPARIDQLLVRLDRPIPVHQHGTILESRVWHAREQRPMHHRRIPIIVHLDTNGPGALSLVEQGRGSKVHRVSFGRLNIDIRIANDIARVDTGGS